MFYNDENDKNAKNRIWKSERRIRWIKKVDFEFLSQLKESLEDVKAGKIKKVG